MATVVTDAIALYIHPKKKAYKTYKIEVFHYSSIGVRRSGYDRGNKTSLKDVIKISNLLVKVIRMTKHVFRKITSHTPSFLHHNAAIFTAGSGQSG